MKKLLLAMLICLSWGTSASAEELIVEREIDKPIPGEEILYEGLDRVIVSIPMPSESSNASFEERVESREGVIDVSDNAVIERQGIISRHQPYIARLGISPLWSTYRGEGVTVAVIDDGIDLTHPEFQGKLVAPYDATRDVPTIVDKGVHGTHVAGTIGALFDNRGVVGVAPAVKLMPIDIFIGEDAEIAHLIKGIQHAVANGAKVINMSFGTYDRNNALEATLRDARAQGVVLIGAAGNDDTEEAMYPAAYKDVLSVGAVTMDDFITDFSNYGSTIDVVAPGEEIYSTLPNGRYGFMSGTSMATPIVSGMAALLVSKEPRLSPGMVYARLKATAVDLGDPGKDFLYGYGRISSEAMNFTANDYSMLRDINPPARPTLGTLTNQSSVITGKAEIGSTIDIHYRGKTYRRNASNGTYRMETSGLQVGSTVTVVARDRALNPSLPITRTVYGVLERPAFRAVSSQSTSIRGTGKKYATLQVFSGQKSISPIVRINSRGEFSLPIPKQRAGTKLTVKMKSPYYISQSYSITVR